MNFNRVEEVENNKITINAENYHHAQDELGKLMTASALMTEIKGKGGLESATSPDSIDELMKANATKLATEIVEYETERRVNDKKFIKSILESELDDDTLTEEQKKLLEKYKEKFATKENEND